MLTVRAALTVGRHSRATARASWMVANTAFQAAGLCSISRLAASTRLATGPGLPAAEPEIILVANARLNMYGWYCKAGRAATAAPGRSGAGAADPRSPGPRTTPGRRGSGPVTRQRVAGWSRPAGRSRGCWGWSWRPPLAPGNPVQFWPARGVWPRALAPGVAGASSPADESRANRWLTGPPGGRGLRSGGLEDAGGVDAQYLVHHILRQAEAGELGQAALGRNEREVAAPHKLPGQPSPKFPDHLGRDPLRRPAGDVDVHVGLVQRHGDQVLVPGPAEMRGHHRQPGMSGGHRIELEGVRIVDPDALAAGLAGADPAGAGVEQGQQAILLARGEDRPVGRVVRGERLQGRVELHSP